MAIGRVDYRKSTNLEPIAQAITYMGQSTNKKDKPDVLANKIKAISTDATGVESEMLVGKTFYAAGQKKTGTMPNRGTWTGRIGVNGKVSIPAGYHNGSGYVDQSITSRGAWSSSLGINGSLTIPEGYHNGQGKITQSIATKGAQTYTPSTVNQTIATGQYLSGSQTIAGDPNLVPANIARGKTIFGVTGTYITPGVTQYILSDGRFTTNSNASNLVKLPSGSPDLFTQISFMGSKYSIYLDYLYSDHGVYAGMLNAPISLTKEYKKLVLQAVDTTYRHKIWLGLVAANNINNITKADFTNNTVSSTKFAALTTTEQTPTGSANYDYRVIDISNISGSYYIVIGVDYMASGYSYATYLRNIYLMA